MTQEARRRPAWLDGSRRAEYSTKLEGVFRPDFEATPMPIAAADGEFRRFQQPVRHFGAASRLFSRTAVITMHFGDYENGASSRF